MVFVKAFVIGGRFLSAGEVIFTDSYGKNQADAGQDNGSSCMLRRSSGGCRFI